MGLSVLPSLSQSDSSFSQKAKVRFIAPPSIEQLTGGGLMFFRSPSKKPAVAVSAPRVVIPVEPANPVAKIKFADSLIFDSRDTVQFYTYFRINSSVVDMNYMDNESHYDKLSVYLLDLLRGGNMAIDSIVITGSSSPEGNTARNKRLSAARYAALRSYLLGKFPMIDSLKISSIDKGENWDDLLSFVESDPNVPNQADVLGILKMSSSRSTREYFLRILNFGTPWRYIRKNILPLLRGGTLISVYSQSTKANGQDFNLVPQEDSLLINSGSDGKASSSLKINDNRTWPNGILFGRDTIFKTNFVVDTINQSVPGRPLWSLKTNLLYWAILQPNVEVEFYFGRHWSLNFEYQIAWWKDRSKHLYYQYTHCGPEGRYWFKGDNKFKGHYIGVHVGFGIYDLSLGIENQQYEGYQGEFAIALGISYGYVWKLGKILHLEAGFGFGYVMTEYRRYRYIDECYVYQSTERMQFLGPTKARVALQWRIGTGSLGKRKGASR